MRRLIAIGAVAIGALATAGPADAFVYWANYGGEGTAGGTTIGRANLDGTGVDNNFIGGASFPCGVAVDDGHVYWANGEDDTGTTLGRANIDGTSVNQAFITGASNPCFPGVDAGHLYWTNFASDSVGRSDLDGGNVNQGLLTGAGVLPCGVVADDSFVYFANQGGDTIGRANINGTGLNLNFITGANAPCGMAINGAHLYWANREGNRIGRSNLDGSGVDQSFVTGASLPCGVAVDDTHIYWANLFNRTIGRANLDGSGANQSFITDTDEFPCGIAVDARVRTTGAVVGCSPGSAALAQPTSCTATISDTDNGPPTTPTGSVGFSSAAGGSGFPGGASCNLAPSGAAQASCSVTYVPGFGSNLVLGLYGGDVAHDDATAIGQVTTAGFSLGGASFNRNSGTALLTATVPGPGSVELGGDRVVAQTLQAAAAGPLQILIRARGVALRKLKRNGSATIVAEVQFTPSGGGQQGDANQPLRLVKRASRSPRRAARGRATRRPPGRAAP